MPSVFPSVGCLTTIGDQIPGHPMDMGRRAIVSMEVEVLSSQDPRHLGRCRRARATSKNMAKTMEKVKTPQNDDFDMLLRAQRPVPLIELRPAPTHSSHCGRWGRVAQCSCEGGPSGNRRQAKQLAYQPAGSLSPRALARQTVPGRLQLAASRWPSRQHQSVSAVRARKGEDKRHHQHGCATPTRQRGHP